MPKQPRYFLKRTPLKEYPIARYERTGTIVKGVSGVRNIGLLGIAGAPFRMIKDMAVGGIRRKK